MKNIANVVILALLISLAFSIEKNYSLLKEVSDMYNYMSDSSDQLKDRNDLVQKSYWNKYRILDNTFLEQRSNLKLFTDDGILAEQYFKNIDGHLSGSQRFYLEKQRRKKLDDLFMNFDEFSFSTKSINSRIAFNDELHIGFQETIFDHCKYEVIINEMMQDYNRAGIYQLPSTPQISIGLNKIYINQETQEIDTISTTKLIGRA